ncbi:hypothetical protein MHBO_001926, partial [Bonamia ostreae]
MGGSTTKLNYKLAKIKNGEFTVRNLTEVKISNLEDDLISIEISKNQSGEYLHCYVQFDKTLFYNKLKVGINEKKLLLTSKSTKKLNVKTGSRAITNFVNDTNTHSIAILTKDYNIIIWGAEKDIFVLHQCQLNIPNLNKISQKSAKIIKIGKSGKFLISALKNNLFVVDTKQKEKTLTATKLNLENKNDLFCIKTDDKNSDRFFTACSDYIKIFDVNNMSSSLMELKHYLKSPIIKLKQFWLKSSKSKLDNFYLFCANSLGDYIIVRIESDSNKNSFTHFFIPL